MSDPDFDIAVLGSGTFSALLAGLLASQHGRRVCLVSTPWSPFRLQRRLDISIAPLTRPESLGLVKSAAAETLSLVNGWGKGLTQRVDPLFVAETPTSIAALDYFRQLALLLGLTVDVVPDRALPQAQVLRVREAQMLVHGKFEPALAAWLGRCDVRQLDPSDTAVSIRKDGTVRIGHAGLAIEARQAVLTGDDAILRYLPREALDRSLAVAPTSALLLEGGRLAAPYVNWLDRGLEAAQEPRATSLAAITTGSLETAEARIGASIAHAGPLSIAGEVVGARLVTLDGAPFIGTARGIRAMVAAGLGPAAAFLAPALARFIAGQPTPDEAAWFAARGAMRGNQRQLVADYAPVPA